MGDSILKKSSRQYYLDNLKVFLTMLVIVHHVGQAYGPTGGFWQYKSSLHENIPWLGSFFGVNAAFFMGLFFMISAYFIPGSLDRKGSPAFIRDRLRRLGIPLMFVFLIIQPLEMYFYYTNYSYNKAISFIQYYIQIYMGIGKEPSWFIDAQGWPERSFGHLWFVENLLVFTIVYFALRLIFSRLEIKYEGEKPLNPLTLLGIPLLIAVVSAFVRQWYPIDRWTGVFGFIQSEVAHLPQYVILFTVGIIAFRRNWFERVSKKTGYISMILGGGAAVLVYFNGYLPGWLRDAIFSNWAFYESFMAGFICLGLIVLFREKLNHTSAIWTLLAENSFAAYIFHFPIVLAIQFSLDKVNIFGAYGKFITVSFLSITITYLVSFLIRKLHYVRRII